jgi:hypothetical protein
MTTDGATPMSNPLDLDAIRARAEAATEGPWHRVGKSIQADVPLSDDGPSTTKWNTTVVCSVGAWGSGRPTGEDAEFIAHARTDVPALLAEVERLQCLVRDLSDSYPCWFDHHGGCQAHGYLSLGPGEKCPQSEAQEIVAEQASGDSRG